MTVPKHLNEAAARLKEASFRIEEARPGPMTCENQKVWLEALTDYCLASPITINNESVHEKLHELAGRAGISNCEDLVRQVSDPRSKGLRKPGYTALF